MATNGYDLSYMNNWGSPNATQKSLFQNPLMPSTGSSSAPVTGGIFAGNPGGLDTSALATANMIGQQANNQFEPNFMQGMLGYTNPQNGMAVGGWGNMALGGINTLMSGYMGMKQYGLAKEQLAESRRQFDKNFKTQAKMTNTRLRDRQRARVSASSKNYQSVDEYMDKNRVEV